MAETTTGPETLLPPRFPPERLGPYFIEKNLVRYVPSKFVDLDGKLNKEGRRFTKELFRNLDAYFDGDFERMREEIVGSEEAVLASKDFDEYEKRQYQKIFRSLRAKFNSQVSLASTRVSAKERLEVSDKNFRDIVKEETEAERKRLRNKIKVSRLNLKRFRPNLNKVWLTAALVVIAGSQTTSYSVGFEPKVEIIKTPSIVSPAPSQIIEKMDEIPFLTSPAPELTVTKVITGTPTLYAPGIWEQVIENRIGKKNPLNPEVVKNPEALEMIKNKKVAAINPAFIEPKYGEVLSKVVQDKRGEGMGDTKIALELGKDEDLKKLGNGVIGKIIEIELKDGTREKLLVMDVFQAEHAAQSLGLISGGKVPRDFVVDLHPGWVKKNLGVTWQVDKGWQDLKGNPVESPKVTAYFPRIIH